MRSCTESRSACLSSRHIPDVSHSGRRRGVGAGRSKRGAAGSYGALEPADMVTGGDALIALSGARQPSAPVAVTVNGKNGGERQADT